MNLSKIGQSIWSDEFSRQSYKFNDDALETALHLLWSDLEL